LDAVRSLTAQGDHDSEPVQPVAIERWPTRDRVEIFGFGALKGAADPMSYRCLPTDLDACRQRWPKGPLLQATVEACFKRRASSLERHHGEA
jgi:hypothetical protein